MATDNQTHPDSFPRYNRGLIIGRFQLIHITHYDLIHYLSNHCREIVIGLGSSQYGPGYPKPGDLAVQHCLTLEERTELLQICFPELNLRIVQLYDYPTDVAWLQQVNSQVGNFDMLLTEKKDEILGFGKKCTILQLPYTSMIRNGILIDKILYQEPYEHLLPPHAFTFLKDHQIPQRLFDLHQIDRSDDISIHIPIIPIQSHSHSQNTILSDIDVARTKNAEETP